jgi:hypothetical protein
MKVSKLIIIFVFFWTGAAFAGNACEEKPPTVSAARNAFLIAGKVLEALETSNAQIVIVGRVGSDLSAYKLRFSHAGLFVKNHPKGKWLAIHELNDCGTANSDLHVEGLANFFADDMFAWDALVVIPSIDLQNKLMIDLSGKSSLLMHEPRYNMLAFPFSTKYQNSNQWLLETLAKPMSNGEVYNRTSAQTWLKSKFFKPSTLEISAAKRLGARMFKANIAFDDHPTDRRMAGLIDVVTVDSIVDFLEKSQMITSKKIVKIN